MLVERLQKEWRAREHVASLYPAPSFAAEGLVLGAGTVLVPPRGERNLGSLKGQEARVLALLSTAYGRSMTPPVLAAIERAAKNWRQGEDCWQ